jgi:protoporphyrinogen oxidase
MNDSKWDLVIIGGGITGMSLAHQALKDRMKCLIIEKEESLGGLAGSFSFKNGVEVEKYYHHWFKSDMAALDLIEQLDLSNKIILKETHTSLLYKGTNWRLTKPTDVLKFSELKFLDRLRLGALLVRARMLKEATEIENESAIDWLIRLGGKEVYRIVWKPLLEGKFGKYASRLSAVWIWKKLQLRGGSRNLKGEEKLIYFDGGFRTLISEWEKYLLANGCQIRKNTEIVRIEANHEKEVSLQDCEGNLLEASKIVFTADTHSLSKLVSSYSDAEIAKWKATLEDIVYLGNICLVLQNRSKISDSYWTNINDPGFPFVGVIEHTNLDKTKNYSDCHIVFLSQYLSHDHENWNLTDNEYFQMATKKLGEAFPIFSTDDVLDYKIHRTRFAQPLMSLGYREKIPMSETPFLNLYICTMAQIYPEDRGTNYAIEYANNFYQRFMKIEK